MTKDIVPGEITGIVPDTAGWTVTIVAGVSLFCFILAAILFGVFV